MSQETERMSQFVHQVLSQRHDQGETLIADGGGFVGHLADHLDREELLQLFNLFFAPPMD
jgi:hypothetical protein